MNIQQYILFRPRNSPTTIHFFPACSSFTGAFFGITGRVTGREAWNGLGTYADDGVCLVCLVGLLFAGTIFPARKAGFLCVFMSLVTFLRPYNTTNKHNYISNYFQLTPFVVQRLTFFTGRYKLCTCDLCSAILVHVAQQLEQLVGHQYTLQVVHICNLHLSSYSQSM